MAVCSNVLCVSAHTANRLSCLHVKLMIAGQPSCGYQQASVFVVITTERLLFPVLAQNVLVQSHVFSLMFAGQVCTTPI